MNQQQEMCGVCGVVNCALAATTNAAALADWRAVHTLDAVLANPMTAGQPGSDESGEGLREVTPRPWPENAWPTAAELADWLSRCTSAERLDYADKSLTTAQNASRCFMQRHEDNLATAEAALATARRDAAELRDRLAAVEALADKWAADINGIGTSRAIRAALANPSAAQGEGEA